ncbi:hypothetical protein [Pontibacter sp. H249]|uniref:hypothetical protein n=1 Tax=Pontibacter sp. H249 TaxID=3133420 RepID=UPI0030BDF350
MINFLRSLFGMGRPAGYRTVAGAPAAPGAKEAMYVQHSNKRLHVLNDLYQKYKNTPHAEKLKTVLEKTKKIHGYLLSKKRVHELELFHVQHTDHFINTFSVIIEVHLRHAAPAAVATPVPEPVIKAAPQVKPQPQPQRPHRQRVPQQTATRPFEDKVEDVIRRIESETVKGIYTAQKVSEMVKRVASQGSMTPVQTQTLPADPLALSLPTISIDTFSKIYYVRELEHGSKKPGEIGFTSGEADKEAFVAHVASRLGIKADTLTYMGNTVMSVPGGYGRGQSMYAPVLNWNGCAYALNLQDYRLYPVKTYRQGRA